MKFSYKFSNLLGTVYRKGNVTFTPDGNSVVSLVGNRVSVFDLKNNKSHTLPIETRLNITCVALSPDGRLAILVTEDGNGLLISLISQSVLGHHNFHHKVKQVKFSPDGSKFAVLRDTVVQVFHAPGKRREFNPFTLFRTFPGHVDETTCLDWTDDSQVLLTGSRDRRTRVVAVPRLANLSTYDLGGPRSAVMGAFFAKNSLTTYSVSQDGGVFVWDCQTPLSDLILWEDRNKHKEGDDSNSEDEETEEEKGDGGGGKKKKKSKKKTDEEDSEKQVHQRIQYTMGGKFRVRGGPIQVTAVTFHKETGMLVTGFQDGVFYLHEMPGCNQIHSLNISDESVDALCINAAGDWVGVASGRFGQLLVWEWQSETYVLKQQGHVNDMTVVTHSPDGQHIVTGGGDGKVKVWNSYSGFCFVTFTEHTGEVTGVKVTENGKSVLSSSMDGTVRAFDLTRYRNYKTLTSPKADQFCCLAVDGAGEIVSAGGSTEFLVYVWSLKTGRLLQTLAGHEAPISGLDFSSTGQLASGSWDGTVKLWGVYEGKGSKESLSLNSDILTLAYSPDGRELAVGTLNAHITLWDTRTCAQTGTIEGRHDLGYGRKETDKIAGKTSAEGKGFECLAYSPDGQCLLAAGQSKHVCIYSVPDRLLLKKFVISCNYSLDGIDEFLDKRKMTEWGNIALVDEGQGQNKYGHEVALPGVKRGDNSSRFYRPEVRVFSLQFSPTGRSWAACSTEGLLLYSLDSTVVFDPYDLALDVTPGQVKATQQRGDHGEAVCMAFRLNEDKLIEEILEGVPVDSVSSLVSSLPGTYVDKLLFTLARLLTSSAHLELWLRWLVPTLSHHGPRVKQRAPKVMGALRSLQRSLSTQYTQLSKIAEHNKYLSQYLISLSKLKRKKNQLEEDKDMNDRLGKGSKEEESAEESMDEEASEEEEEGLSWKEAFSESDDNVMELI